MPIIAPAAAPTIVPSAPQAIIPAVRMDMIMKTLSNVARRCGGKELAAVTNQVLRKVKKQANGECGGLDSSLSMICWPA